MTTDNFRRYDIMLFPVAFFVRDTILLWGRTAYYPMAYRLGADLLAASCWLAVAAGVDWWRTRWGRRAGAPQGSGKPAPRKD